ncbi:hypothetical protein B0H14DRAFT_2575980 [Mycena olivaceomarginata]|nr:hypothetical protein B0H14DRAFT_2575980 [Mycena olivaceomarginata]
MWVPANNSVVPGPAFASHHSPHDDTNSHAPRSISTNVTINLVLTTEPEIIGWLNQYKMLAQVVITCRVPTLFHLVWSGAPPVIPGAGFSSFENIASSMLDDVGSVFLDWYDVAPISPLFSLNQTARTFRDNVTSDVLALASGQKARAFWLWYQSQSQATD